jgi:hypothetical protein
MAKRAKQAELPGTERKTIAELDAAMEHYAEKRDAWVSARTEVQAAKEKLVQLAKAHGVTIYRDETANPPLVLTLTERDAAVKVTAAAGAGAIDEADDEGDEDGEVVQ